MKWSINNHEKLTSISCFTSFFNVRISLSCIQMLLIQWWKLSLDVVSYIFYESPVAFLAALSTWPTYITYLPDWPTHLTYLPAYLTWLTCMTNLPDLRTRPTYLPDLAFNWNWSLSKFLRCFFLYKVAFCTNQTKSLFSASITTDWCVRHTCASQEN